MCRLFALRANQPTRVVGPLLSAPHALLRQSCCDRRGQCHDNGWGIGWYVNQEPHLVRSALSAAADPRYRVVAEAVVSPTVLAHVRRASTGIVAEHNSHPFRHGRWLFAHNGTLFGFAADPERLRRLIPSHLRQCISGDTDRTDSEHAFYFLLGRLEQKLGGLDRPAGAEVAAEVLRDGVATLVELFPGAGEDLSQLNLVLTDGRILVASRWRHTLFWLQRRGPTVVAGDGPVEGGPDYHALVVASEPTTLEPWSELPERSVLQVDADLTCAVR